LTPVEQHTVPMGLYTLVPDDVGIFRRQHNASVDRFRAVVSEGLPDLPPLSAEDAGSRTRWSGR